MSRLPPATERLRVRRAVAADAAVVAALIDELNAHQQEPTGHVTPKAVARDGFGQHPEFAVLLAELDGGPVGYALYHPTWSTEVGERGFYLYDLYVRAGARGHGVGRALMAGLAARAKCEGRTFLWWSSKAWNQEARAFYRNLGAIEEEARSHALLGDAFEALAQAAPPGEA